MSARPARSAADDLAVSQQTAAARPITRLSALGQRPTVSNCPAAGEYRKLFLISTAPRATEASAIRNTKTALPSAKGGFVCDRHSVKSFGAVAALTNGFMHSPS